MTGVQTCALPIYDGHAGVAPDLFDFVAVGGEHDGVDPFAVFGVLDGVADHRLAEQRQGVLARQSGTAAAGQNGGHHVQIGRASCRERV